LLAAGGIAGAAASGSIATVPTGPENPFYFNHNPVHHNYYHYHSTTSATARKTVYIDCLFDKNLNHTAGEIPENEFDRLSTFEESLENPEAVHIFTHNDKLHYGFYEKESGLYKIYNLAR